MREKLIELIKESKVLAYCDCHYNDIDYYSKQLADYLLKNDIVVLPCKVGDKTFLLLEKTNGGYDIVESKCVRIVGNGYGKYYSMAFDCDEIGNTLEFGACDFGRSVFLTKEEAEKALERSKQ